MRCVPGLIQAGVWSAAIRLLGVQAPMVETLDLSHIPVVDQHCHPWRRPTTSLSADEYRMLFTEGGELDVGLGVPGTVYYRWTLRELAGLLGCAAREPEVLDARAALGHDAFAARLMAAANIEAAVLDFKYAGRGAENFTVEEMSAQLGGAVTIGALRLETVLEELVLESSDAGEVEERFRARLNRETLRAENVASLKSIIAYRTGLAIEPVKRETAYGAFGTLKAEATSAGRVRIADKAFLDYFLLIALEWCATERFPIQFHTGFGDTDVSLLTGNPLQLRTVFQDGRFRNVPLVLLHAGYPFVRELSYLASVYPNVYLDLGLAIPFVATEFETIVRQALALAPSSRVLYSSDGFTIPEHFWFAAVHGRRALGTVLGELIDWNMIGREDAAEMAEQILRSNARRLYGLEPTA